jgi:hypothetical protein
VERRVRDHDDDRQRVRPETRVALAVCLAVEGRLDPRREPLAGRKLVETLDLRLGQVIAVEQEKALDRFMHDFDVVSHPLHEREGRVAFLAVRLEPVTPGTPGRTSAERG